MGEIEVTQLELDTSTEPTVEELSTLEHVADQIPLAAWLIVICEFCERFAFMGLSGPFQNYIQFPEPGPNEKQPGALGRGHQTATLLTTFFRFLCYLTPIGGAILADQFWGKYKTILIGCQIYAIGLIILVATSIPAAIHAGIAFPGLIVAMIVLGFATGGVKSNVSPLMAEQYTRTKPIVKVIKERKVIVDPKVTIQSMFNWFYWMINIGALSSIITTNIEKYHSFWLAYLLPLLVFTGSIIVLVIGRHRYIKKPPNGSLLIRAGRVMVSAFQIRWTLGKQQPQQHILDYAKDTASNSDHNQFIDELKQALRACRVFCFYPFYWLAYGQLSNNMISQAAQMNVGPLPNDILQNIDPIVLIIFIPIFEKWIYPLLRKKKIKFNSITRITYGFLCMSIAMAWTAFVQYRIYSTGPNYDYATAPCKTCQQFNSITAAWQIPSYFFIAVSEIFASVTGLEYAFTQAPPSMKSVVMSLFLFTSAISSAFSFALLPITVDPTITWLYASLAMLAFVVGLVFFLLFRKEQEKEPESPSSLDK